LIWLTSKYWQYSNRVTRSAFWYHPLTITAFYSAVNFPVLRKSYSMPGGSGLDAIRQIRAKKLAVRIVVLSMHSGREMVMEALQAGCDGYVPKSTAHSDLIQAIRTVYAGKRFLHPDAATALVDELLDKQEENKLTSLLSERELDVIKLSAMGFTSREIGEKLALSPKTVDTYRERAMQKLQIESRSDIIRFALRAGLLDSLNAAKKDQ
jgi:two-component system, NarL family, response regulator NreC